MRHGGNVRRTVQRDTPGTLLGIGIFGLGMSGIGRGPHPLGRGRHALDILGIVDGHAKRLGGIQNIVAEFGRKLGQTHLDLVEAFLVGPLQPNAAQRHGPDVEIDRPLHLGQLEIFGAGRGCLPRLFDGFECIKQSLGLRHLAR